MNAQLLENLDLIASSKNGVKKIRQLILELAVRGKLVPQDPNDEPASELLKKIQSEKKKLLADGKIEIPLKSISDSEKLFDLPKKWEWVRFESITKNIHYGYTDSADHNSKDILFLRITDIQDDKVNWDQVPGCRIDKKTFSNYSLVDGDILIARTGGTIGKSYLVEGLNKKAVFASYLIRAEKINSTYPSYTKVFLGSQIYWKQLYESSMGTGQPNVNGTALKALKVPLPPLKEQYRIVTKVDELMKICDQLENQQTLSENSLETLVKVSLDSLSNSKSYKEFIQNWNLIEKNFETIVATEESVDELKKTILQLAVIGKLVPQNPNDEPASELLKKIQSEKQKLLAEGKIKKEKPLSSIDDSEKPFDLPKGWGWFSLRDYTIIKGGGTPSMSKSEYWDGDIPWISPKDMHIGNIMTSELKITQRAIDETNVELVPSNSILLVGRSGILKRKLPVQITSIPCTVNQDLKAITPIHPLFSKYIQLLLIGTEKKILKEDVKQGTTVQSLVYEKLFSRVFGLPPLAEQHRIVAKVDELMKICDTLKIKITESKNIQNQMSVNF